MACDNANSPTPIDSERVFDDNGFDQYGIHRDTETEYDPDGYNQQGYDENDWHRNGKHKHTGTEYDGEGYNKNGFDKNGLDKDGYDVDGYKNGWKDGDPINNITKLPCDPFSYDKEGNYWYDEVTGFDYFGYNEYGVHEDGYDRDGYYPDGWHKDGGWGKDLTPYDDKGCTRDGDYWHDDDGYDYEGYHVTTGLHKDGGYNRDGYYPNGWHKDGGWGEYLTPYDDKGYDKDGTYWRDNEGFDFKGINERGFYRNKEHINGGLYDDEGYDYEGLDKNGFEKITPITAPTIQAGNNTNFDSQANAQYTLNWNANISLENNVTNVRAQFNQYSSNNVDPAIQSSVNSGTDTYNNLGRNTGDRVVDDGIHLMSTYLVTMSQTLLTTEKENKFKLIMNTYRTKAYNDFRFQDKFNTEKNPGYTDLQNLYSQLGSINTNENDFDAYLDNYIKDELSLDLRTNPGLLRTLLNQIQGFEQFYASVDDAKAKGYNPTLSNFSGTYEQQVPLRTLSHTDSILVKHSQ